MTWLGAFLATLAVEVPIYTVLLRPWATPSRRLFIGVAVNVVSHPALWFSLRALHPRGAGYVIATVLAEALVVVGEAALARVWLPPVRPRLPVLLRISAIANLASVALGVVWSLILLRP